MGSIVSNSFTCKSGSGTVSLTHSSLLGVTNAFSVSKLGKLSYKELEDNEILASSVYLSLGEFSFSCFDKMAIYGSVFETIDSLNSTDAITVTLSFTLNNGRSFTDTFVTYKNDMSYDETRRETSFKASQTSLDKGALNTSLSTNYTATPSNVKSYDGVNANTTCLLSKHFIERALGYINTNITGSNIINNSNSFTSEPSDYSVVNGAYDTGTNIFYVIPKTLSGNQEETVASMLLKLAAIDGSIIGSMLGYSFFVNRTKKILPTINPIISTKISQSDVKSIKIKSGYNSLYSSKLVFISNDSDGLNGSQVANNFCTVKSYTPLNHAAKKTLNIFFTSPNVSRATWVDNPSESDPDLGKYDGTGYTVDDELDTYTSLNANKEDTQLLVDDGSGGSSSLDLSDGDIIYFKGYYGEFYEVYSLTSTSLTLKEPLRQNVSENSRVVKINTSGGIDSGIATTALQGYNKMYGGDGARNIEITIFGIDTVKPYQSFKLDSTFRSLLQDKYFRAKTYEADLMTDTVNMTAYEI